MSQVDRKCSQMVMRREIGMTKPGWSLSLYKFEEIVQDIVSHFTCSKIILGLRPIFVDASNKTS